MAIEEIRKLLESVPEGAMIATRQVLHLAKNRGAIDTAMSRLHANKEITRIAWGLYIKGGPNTPQPSIAEIAHAKARAFHKIIASVSSQFARQVGLPQQEFPAEMFAVSGRSSRIWSSQGAIQYVGASMRKLVLRDSQVGTQLRTMWHLGKGSNPALFLEHTINGWTERDWDECAARFEQLPEWLSKMLALPTARTGSTQFILT